MAWLHGGWRPKISCQLQGLFNILNESMGILQTHTEFSFLMYTSNILHSQGEKRIGLDFFVDPSEGLAERERRQELGIQLDERGK